MISLKMCGAPTGKIKISDSIRPLRLHGSIGLVLGVLGSALGAALMRHGNYGLSSFYAVSLALYRASMALSMGAWNTIYQTVLILSLMLCLRCVRWRYMVSFVVAIGSSVLIDHLSALTARLPDILWVRVCCFLSGLLILSVGISLLATCKLPVMPMNLFVREMAEALHWSFGRFKLLFDLTCLTFSTAVGLVFTGTTPGVGWGTLISVLAVGPLINAFISIQRRFVEFSV